MPAAERNQLNRLLNSLALAPRRVCQTMHACCLCPHDITIGQRYCDRGLDRRAHVECLTNKRAEIAANELRRTAHGNSNR